MNRVGSGTEWALSLLTPAPLVRADLHGLDAGLRLGPLAEMTVRRGICSMTWNGLYKFTGFQSRDGELKGVDMNAGQTGSSEIVLFGAHLRKRTIPHSRLRLRGEGGSPAVPHRHCYYECLSASAQTHPFVPRHLDPTYAYRLLLR